MAGSILEIRKKIEGVKNTRLKSIYTEKREKGGILFVLYTSDKGLCGPLNNKLINGLFRSELWQTTPEDERKLITIGKKSYDYVRNNKIPVTKHYTQIPEKLTTVDSIKIVEGIIELWKEEKIKQVIFVAPHYKNSFTFYPVLKTFLPFTEETIASTLGPIEEYKKSKIFKKEGCMLFSPSEAHVLNRLYEQMVQALFLQAFIELKASEYSSRMIAMQNATDSADRIVNDLTREYNKVRQAVITQEIAELMGASLTIK
ncbi:MAG: ATP synthase gamma chain [Candidatus Peregrinibacteria bacterium GW2011_GWA2_44_7]|nr:MAG: ATP synthase gamma chain [Candidatus Peregrinibacteria bacterium GW2011_GWA2_44_7]